MATPAGFVVVAEAVKAVGLRGEIKLFPLIDWHEPLLEGDWLLWDDGTPFVADGWRTQGGGIVTAVEGIADRDAAEGAVGRMVGFLRSRYPERGFPKPPGGLPFRWLERPVLTVDGREIGKVDEVRDYGGGYVLVLPGPHGEILVPTVAAILRPDDGLTGPLVIDPPEGLLDAAED